MLSYGVIRRVQAIRRNDNGPDDEVEFTLIYKPVPIWRPFKLFNLLVLKKGDVEKMIIDVPRNGAAAANALYQHFREDAPDLDVELNVVDQ